MVTFRPLRPPNRYRRPNFRFIRLLQCRGSVLPHTLPGVLFSGFVTFTIMFWDLNLVMSDYHEPGAKWFFHPSTHGMFLQFAAFLLAFHVQSAYSRWWEARTHLQVLNSKWSAVASDLIAFDLAIGATKENRTAEDDNRSAFLRAQVIHLVSMLHAVSVERLIGPTKKLYQLDIFGAPTEYECEQIHSSIDRSFSVMNLLNTEIAQHHMEGALPVPPPWLNGVHNNLNDGVRAFDAAVGIKETPFPFMYIQLHYFIDLLVLIFTPLLMSSYFKDIAFGVAMTMLVVFSSHSLFTAAFVMETPFGLRPSDLPLVNLHKEFIEKLTQLIDFPVADALDSSGLQKTSSASSLHLGRFSVVDLRGTRDVISRYRFDIMSEIRSHAHFSKAGHLHSPEGDEEEGGSGVMDSTDSNVP